MKKYCYYAVCCPLVALYFFACMFKQERTTGEKAGSACDCRRCD